MSSTSHSRGLALVAIWKVVEGIFFVVLALAAFHMLHKDVNHTLIKWLRMARLNPESRYLGHALAKAGLVSDRQLKQIGVVLLAYAALFFTEGFGLLCHKRWAEYLTVIATASLVPLEAYEVWRHPTWIKAAVLVGNVAVVVYLAVILRDKETKPERR